MITLGKNINFKIRILILYKFYNNLKEIKN